MSRPTVVIIDHGSGNLRSAERALEHVGADVTVTADPKSGLEADGTVLPGVGAYAACMAGVVATGADDVVRSRIEGGRPVLGICVGMQVMYDGGEEHGLHTTGIGVLPGDVVRLEAPILPHMGWSPVTTLVGSPLFAGVEHERFYFVHSYAARPSPSAESAGETLANHGTHFVAAVEAGPVSATQFHPEKSGQAGLALLRNWVSSLR